MWETQEEGIFKKEAIVICASGYAVAKKKKCLKWSNESMEAAIQAMKDGRCKIKEAARI